MQDWDIKIALESTYSTHANRIGSDDFKLKLTDVCWDIPLTAPTLTESEYELYLFDSNAGNVNGISDVITLDQPMDISWTDPNYCGGFSYSITYISGPANANKLKEEPLGDGVLITDAEIEAEINAIWVNTDGQITFPGFPDDDDWIDHTTGIGIYTLQIKGTTG